MLTERCPWYVAGPLLGLLITGLRWAVNKPFGALGGFIDAAESAGRPSRFGFRTWLLGGLVSGGAVYAIASETFSLTVGYPDPGMVGFGLLLAAGFLMGVGARTAGGCTSGHGMTGLSLGSPDSIVATITFFSVAVAAAHVLPWIGGAR